MARVERGPNFRSNFRTGEQHTPSALQALADKGYHILLEKPMAVTSQDCRRIVEAVKRNGVILAVGHVLRYTPYMQKMKELIASGVIGEVVNVQHLEPIGNWHFAHSYVRGSWRREDESTFMLMAKCCHDVDLIRYIMDKPCTRVSSFGALTHFKPEKKPPESGSAVRCLDCPLQDSCPYSAKTIYLQRAQNDYFAWPVAMLLDGEPSVPAVEAALRTGPYGRCVWACDNDVADHQVVSMEFEGGASATLTTTAFTEAICQRRTRVFGSLGELNGDGDSTIRHFDFRTGKATLHELPGAPPETGITGHNGADYFLIESFVRAVATLDPTAVLSGPDETLESHLIVFAAEAARRAGVVVSVQDVLSAGIAPAVASATAVAVGAKVAASGQATAVSQAQSEAAIHIPPVAGSAAPLSAPHTLTPPLSAASPLLGSSWGMPGLPGTVPPASSGAPSLPPGSTVTAHIATASGGQPPVTTESGHSLVTVTSSAPMRDAEALPGGLEDQDVVLEGDASQPLAQVPLVHAAVSSESARGLGAVPVSISTTPSGMRSPTVNSQAQLPAVAASGGGAWAVSSPLSASQGSPHMPAGVLPATISVSISAHDEQKRSGFSQGPADTAGVAMVPVAAAVGSVLGAIHSVTSATPRATAVGGPFAPSHSASIPTGDEGEDLLLDSSVGKSTAP